MTTSNHPLSDGKRKPRFFYGYFIVVSAFTFMVFTFGINYSFAIFLKPLLVEFNWTAAATAGAYSMMTIVAGFLGIFAGRLSDLFGPRILGIAAGFFLGAGFFLMSQVTAIWQLYMIHGLLLAAGIGCTWPTLMPTIARWFTARRGLMTGIVASGIGVGTVVVPLLATWLIAIYEWRMAYIIIGAITLIVIVLASVFLKSDPGKIGQLPYGSDTIKNKHSLTTAQGFSFKEAVGTKNFALMVTAFFCFGFLLHSIMVHIVNHAIYTGISVVSGATVFAVIGISNGVGRIVMAGISDRIGIKLSLIIGFAITSVALFWLQIARELWMFYLFAVPFGFAYGDIIAAMALAPAEFFGLRSLGVILGTVTFAYTIGGAVGPAATGYIFDVTGDYYLAFLISAVLSVAGFILVALLKSSLPQRDTIQAK